MKINTSYTSLSNSLFDKNLVDNIKCLFVTGGAGFIGSNFINLFSKNIPVSKLLILMHFIIVPMKTM